MSGIFEIPGLLAGSFTAVATFAKYGEQLFFADEDIYHTWTIRETVIDQLCHVRTCLKPIQDSLSPDRRAQIERLLSRSDQIVNAIHRHLTAADLVVEPLIATAKPPIMLQKVVERSGRAVKWVICDRNRIMTYLPTLQALHSSLTAVGLELILMRAPIMPTPPMTSASITKDETPRINLPEGLPTQHPIDDLPAYREIIGYTEESKADLVRELIRSMANDIL